MAVTSSADSLRILHIVQRYWPAPGGAETYIGELSSRLAAEGHRVTVATTDALDFELFWDPHRRRIPARAAVQDGVRILRFPVRHVPFCPPAYAGLRRLLWLASAAHPVPTALMSRIARFTPWVPELWHWLATTDEPFDLVAGVSICFEPLVEAGLRHARHHGLPFIVYPLTHLGAGTRPGTDALSRFYTMRHQVALVKASDGVIVQTPDEQSFYAERGTPAAGMVIASPGVYPERILGGDGARFRARHQINGPLVASLSAMSYDKGTVSLVEAVRRLWRDGRQVELALAGAVTAPFQRYLSTLPAAERHRLHVLGPVDEAEKRDLYAAADIFAMPSRTDSFGIVYLEAWLYGKPVIGATTWGVRTVIADGEDGLLAPFGDAPALAASIGRLLDHPDERARMGERGRQKVYSLHTWDRKYVLVRDLYRRLAEPGQ